MSIKHKSELIGSTSITYWCFFRNRLKFEYIAYSTQIQKITAPKTLH